MKSVFVTGGNGHLGFNLVKQLSENGFFVRTSVRNIKDNYNIFHLNKIPNVEIIETDLFNLKALHSAMYGMDAVFHTAAPVTLWSKNLKDEIINPIITGTQNIFKIAKERNIKNIVFTSSSSACGMNSSKVQPLTENDWNTFSDFPLLKAKIEAEKWALSFAKQNNIRMVSILPPTIIGPYFYKITPSLNLYHMMYQNKTFSLPHGGCHIVDVRDVANSHIQALLNETAHGRYLIAGEYFHFEELFSKIKNLKLDKTIKVPNYLLPMWSIYMLNSLDWLNHKLLHRPRTISLSIIKNFLNKYQHISTERAKNELNWQPRRTDVTLIDTFNWFANISRS